MQNESTMEQSLESVDDEDLGQEIERLSKELEQIQSGRELSDLTKDEAGKVLKLLKKIKNAQEKINVEKAEKEKYWSYDMFVDWAKNELENEEPEKWLKEKFDLSDLSNPKLKIKNILLSSNSLKKLPPNMICEGVAIFGAPIEKIPNNVRFKSLLMRGCMITQIPNGTNFTILNFRSNEKIIQNVGDDIYIEKLIIPREIITDDVFKKLIKLEEAGKIGEIIWK